MTYPADLDEWRHAVADMSEGEREFNANADRAALGVIGEATDDLYGGDAR